MEESRQIMRNMFYNIKNRVIDGGRNMIPVNYHQINLSQMPCMNRHIIDDRLYNSDKYDDETIRQTIEIGMDTISEQMINNLFINNSRLLKLLDETISNMRYSKKTIPYKIKRNWCSVLYNYLNNLDVLGPVLDTIISITENMYIMEYTKINNIGFSKKFAAMIIISRYAEQSEMVNIKRLNRVLIYSNEQIDTQKTVYIYESLFDYITELFMYTLFDYIDGLTSHNLDVYNSQIMAVLEILNNMAIDQITRVVKECCNLDTTDLTRFSLVNLPQNYDRIKYVVQMCIAQGYKIPY